MIYIVYLIEILALIIGGCYLIAIGHWKIGLFLLILTQFYNVNRIENKDE